MTKKAIKCRYAKCPEPADGSQYCTFHKNKKLEEQRRRRDQAKRDEVTKEILDGLGK